jgi:Ribonuclease G/E
MNLFTRFTRTATRLVRTVVEAPAVARQLAELRTTNGQNDHQSPRLVEVDIDPNDIPDTEDIVRAARDYQTSKEERRGADRLKRRAERILRRTPNGTHGTVTVQRVESSRQVIDAEAVKALFAAHGLGPVPTRVCGPSLTITFAEAEAAAEDTAPVLAAAA